MLLFRDNACCGIYPAVRVGSGGEILWAGGNVYNLKRGEYVVHHCTDTPNPPSREELAEMAAIPAEPGWYVLGYTIGHEDPNALVRMAGWEIEDMWDALWGAA